MNLFDAITRWLYRTNLDESVLIVLFAALVLVLFGGSMRVAFVVLTLLT